MLKRITRIFFSMVLVESIKDTSQKITCSNYKRILSASLAIAKDLSLYQSTYKYCCELSKTQSANEERRNILVQNCVESYIKYRKNSHLQSLQLLVPNTESISKANSNRHNSKDKCGENGSSYKVQKTSKNPKNKTKEVIKCKCDKGWRGKTCNKQRKKKRKKQKAKCKNGEESVVNGRSKCLCFDGFKGKRCGKRISNDVISYDPSSYYSSSSVSYQDSEGNYYDAGSRRPYKCPYGNGERHSTTCWNVRVQSKGRRKKRQLKKFRVTCPLHSCAAQQIPKGEGKDKKRRPETATDSPLELTATTGLIEKHTTKKPLQTTRKTSASSLSPSISATTIENSNILASQKTTTKSSENKTTKSTTTTTATKTTTTKISSTNENTSKRSETRTQTVEIEKLFSKSTLPPIGEIHGGADSDSQNAKFQQESSIYAGRKNKFRLLAKDAEPEFCGEGELEIRTKRSRKWFRCLCPDFMEGRNCEHHLNYCRLYYGQYQKRPCEHYCENGTRAYYCACHDGFMLAQNGYNCERIANLCFSLTPARKMTNSLFSLVSLKMAERTVAKLKARSEAWRQNITNLYF